MVYSVKEYAELKKVKPDTVRTWCKTGKVDAEVESKKWLIYDPPRNDSKILADNQIAEQEARIAQKRRDAEEKDLDLKLEGIKNIHNYKEALQAKESELDNREENLNFGFKQLATEKEEYNKNMLEFKNRYNTYVEAQEAFEFNQTARDREFDAKIKAKKAELRGFLINFVLNDLQDIKVATRLARAKDIASELKRKIERWCKI